MGLAPTTTTSGGGGGGTFRLLYDIAKVEGYSGLFRSSSIAWVPGGARMLYFTVYEHVADFLGTNLSHHHWLRHDVASSTPASVVVNMPIDSHTTTTAMTHYPGWVYGAAGGISTFASQLIMAPYSVISSRLQIATGPNNRLSAMTVLRDVLSRPNGLRALWTGYYSAIAQLGPQHATMWAVSSWLQDQLVMLACDDGDYREIENAGELSHNRGENTLGLLPRLGTSMCGSFIAIVVTSPIDAVRTHRQIMISQPLPPPSSSSITTTSGRSGAFGVGGSGHTITVPSSWSTFVFLYGQQGLRAFTTGIIPRALANCPGMIAMMVGYQYVKQLAEHVQRQQQKLPDE